MNIGRCYHYHHRKELHRAKGGMWVIIVAVVISMIPIWLSFHSLSWTGQQHVASREDMVCNPQNFLVLIKAGAKSQYQQRRKIWRGSTCPASYKQHSMDYHFMVAMPAHEHINPNGHNQAARASREEILDMKKLRNEATAHEDIEFLPLKDIYDDSNLKVISMMRWAVDRGMTDETSVVIIHDDEYCLQTEVLQTICEDTVRSNSSLYAGSYLYETAEYEIQKGFDGSFAPFFSGHLYALSSDLVKDIAYDPDTLFTSQNLGYAEDLQVGTWVKNQADRNDRPRQIRVASDMSILWQVASNEEGDSLALQIPQLMAGSEEAQIGSDESNVLNISSSFDSFAPEEKEENNSSEVSCGRHFASACAECPQGNGASWCNGDCVWSTADDTCSERKASDYT